MDDYNFWADLLATFRALNDWVKALIVLGFYGTITIIVLGSILLLRCRRPAHESLQTREKTGGTIQGQVPYLLTKQRETMEDVMKNARS